MQNASYFLGAGSSEGFYSLYDELFSPAIHRLYILKGGPGNGKSTFLHIIADAAKKTGQSVERIFCASDPDSLDAVILPETGQAWVDGTAPHTVEAKLPGVRDLYIDLGVFYDHAALSAKADSIAEAFADYAEKQKARQRALRALGTVYADLRQVPDPAMAERLTRRAYGIVSRLLPNNGTGHGILHRRILSAFTSKGTLHLYDDILQNYHKICVLKDNNGLGEPLLKALREAALARGTTVVACINPLLPESLSHILLPEVGAAFLSADLLFSSPLLSRHPAIRHIRLNEKREKEESTSRRLLGALLERVMLRTGEAKASHDRLEALYHDHVDFEGVCHLAERMAKTL